MSDTLSPIDWIVIGVYLTVVMLIGLRVAGRQRTTRDYFLGDRSIPWWAAALSIIATETSAVTFIGYPGLAYRGDWRVAQLIFGFIAGRIFLAYYFLQVFYGLDVVTVYGFLEKRFGNWTRALGASLFLCGRVLASGVRLYAACLAIEIAAGLRIEYAIIGLGVFAIGYTLIGGIRSVVWTDCVLGLTFMAGGVLAAVFILVNIDGGLGAIIGHEVLGEKVRVVHLGASAPDGSPATWRDFFASDAPLVVGLAGGFVLTLATHGTDQDIVQRMLTCQDARDGGRSLIGSAVIILPLTLLFLLVGTLLWLLHDLHPEFRPEGVANPDHFFPDFIVRYVPAGLAGFLFAGVFAAALSSLTSVLNALSSTLISDFYRPFVYRGGREEHYLLASRVATFLCGAGLVAVALGFIGSGDSVFAIAMKALTYFYGALLGVFLLGIFTGRGTGVSTTAGMLISVVVVLALQWRAFIEQPQAAPAIVASWIESTPDWLTSAVRWCVPLLAWPYWIVLGTGVSLGVGLLGRRKTETGE